MEELAFESHQEVSEACKKAMGFGFVFIHVRASMSGLMAFDASGSSESFAVQSKAPHNANSMVSENHGGACDFV